MKKILLYIGLLLISISGFAQYNPAQHTVLPSPLGPTGAFPADARSYMRDGSVYRLFTNTAEVLSYLNNSTKRFGSVMYFVNVGGTTVPYWFNGGFADGNLQKFFKPLDDSAVVLRSFFADAANISTGTLSTSRLPASVVLTSSSYSNPSWITTLAWSKITSAPSFALQQSLVDSINVMRDSLELIKQQLAMKDTVRVQTGLIVKEGVGGAKDTLAIEGMTDSPIAGYAWGFNESLQLDFIPVGTGSGNVTSVFTREGAVIALESDYEAFYPKLSEEYNDPSFIDSLGANKLKGTVLDARLPSSMSNKTLVNPKISIADLEPGTLLIADGSGSLSVLPPGPEGYVLTVVGGSPAWAEPGGDPLLSVSTTSLSGFSINEGVASAIDSFSVGGLNLTGDATVTLTTADGFQMSLNKSAWQTTPFTLSEAGGILTGQPVWVYVRIASSASVGSREGLITVTSSGATNKTVNLYGTVTEDPVPTIVRSPSTLTGFTTEEGTASTAQSFTASGTNLTDDITVTAPPDFEVSLSSGSGYGSSVTLTETAGTVTSTTVYVRIAATASEGAVSGDVECTSPGATQQDVSVSGSVEEPEPPAETPLTFSTISGSVTPSGGDYTGQNGAYMLCDYNLPASVDGWIQYTYSGTANQLVIIGFDASGTNNNWLSGSAWNWSVGHYTFSNGAYFHQRLGQTTGTSTGVSAGAGDKIRLDRTSGTITLQRQTGGVGAWTTIATYGAGPYTGKLYIKVGFGANSKTLNDPIGFGVVPN